MRGVVIAGSVVVGAVVIVGGGIIVGGGGIVIVVMCGGIVVMGGGVGSVRGTDKSGQKGDGEQKGVMKKEHTRTRNRTFFTIFQNRKTSSLKQPILKYEEKMKMLCISKLFHLYKIPTYSYCWVRQRTQDTGGIIILVEVLVTSNSS